MWVTDIKAVHHIHQGYNWAREPARRELARSLGGQGVLWADGKSFGTLWNKQNANRVPGETHKRQRKVVQPAFGVAETKALLPVFRRCVESVSAIFSLLSVSETY